MISEEDMKAFREMAEYEGYLRDMELLDMTPADMVKEFQNASNQDPQPYLYAALIKEEMEEWWAERLKNNDVSELKELSDLVYVIFGYAVSRGWDLMEALRRVHENNMGRMKQPDGTIKYREDGKVIKNPDYPKVDLGDLV